MKKLFLGVVALAATLSANAIVGFNYSTTSMYTIPATTIFTDLNNCSLLETTAPTSPNVTGKNSINATAAGAASFSMGGVVWSYTAIAAGNTIAKQYQNYVQPNGDGRTLTIPTVAGNVVTIMVPEAAAGVTVGGVDGMTSIDLAVGANTITATGSSVTLTITATSKPKFAAVFTSASAGVSSATANKSGVSLQGDVLVNPSNLNVTVYNMAGAKVLSSSAASINVSALKGAFVATTVNGSVKFAK